MIEKLKINEEILDFEWEWKKISFKSGLLAPQVDGSVLVSFEWIKFLSTCSMHKGQNLKKDFLPLVVDFREMFYSAGKIWWSPYRRKEWRPSDDAVLISRIVDRSLRPMFPSWMVNDVILNINTFQIDKENQYQVPWIISASLAIMLAWIPFEGPVWAVMIGYKDWKFFINPKKWEDDFMSLTIAWTKDTITMVECAWEDVPNEIIVKAIDIAQKEIKNICKKQEEFIKKFNIKQLEITKNKPEEDFEKEVQEIVNNYENQFFPCDKKTFWEVYNKIREEVTLNYEKQIEDWSLSEVIINTTIFKTVKKLLRKHLLKTWQRIDWRNYNKVRNLFTDIWLFERSHGTGLFQRWETQVLAFTTLWAPWKYLLKDTLELDDVQEHFMHHYYMPPYTVNEARAYRGQWRREIWHWFLAEKWLKPIIPKKKDFPYTLRIASEVLSSNGSTSMASVCAWCLSLMDAGVPIKKPVSWIAMWLVIEELEDDELKEYKKNKDLKTFEINWKTFAYMILTDLQWQEDFTWDMDFKIAWSNDWINALQMDMKVKWLPTFVLQEAIGQWNQARKCILDFMLQTISKPKEKISPYAPSITKLNLTSDNVRTIIWKWWETIKYIIEQTNVAIDFEDDGTTIITSENEQDAQKAINIINDLIWEPKVWEKINWKISRVEDYWVFVNLGKWKSWLCHVSNLSKDYIKDVKAIFNEWDEILVEITNIKTDGKIEIKKA